MRAPPRAARDRGRPRARAAPAGGRASSRRRPPCARRSPRRTGSRGAARRSRRAGRRRGRARRSTRRPGPRTRSRPRRARARPRAPGTAPAAIRARACARRAALSIAAAMMSEVDHNVIEEGGRMLIDCDIHVGYETVLDLAPYLDPATREVVVNCGTNGLGMPSYPWYHPTGWLRTDAFDRASAAVGSQLVGQTLDRVRAKVLDPLDLSYGILTPDEAAAFSILPNGILAAHLAGAYNDWLLEHWLEPEPRLRGLIVIPAQHPEAAAAEIRRVGDRDE